MTAALSVSPPLEQFGRLYRATLGLVRAVLARLGVPEAALDDATQDVYVVVYRRRARFDSARPIEPWLVGIARRVGFRYRRSHARGQRAHEALAWATTTAATEPVSTRIEARQFLERFIAALPEARRQVFVLGELYGMTGPEIAARLQIPVDTAYTRLRAARLQLERALIADASAEPAPNREVAQRGWLLLLPRLIDSPAPATGGWLAAALAKIQSGVGALVVAGVASVAAIVAISAPDHNGDVAASAAPARRPKLPARPANEASSPTPSLPTAALAPPPSNSRFEALLGRAASPPPAPARSIPSPAAAPAGDALGAALMAAAVEALAAGAPSTALARVEQHAREFPNSALAQTRAITRVRALCLLGRAREARGEAAALRSRDPAVARDALAGTCAEVP